jgi:hypothetical protein
MDTRFFRVNGVSNRIDTVGNHFVDGRCVNPKSYEGVIGDTHPPEDAELEPAITVTGFVPYSMKENKNGWLVFTRKD